MSFAATTAFQSPPIGVSHCNRAAQSHTNSPGNPFSPLQSGLATAILPSTGTAKDTDHFQSPPIGVSHCNLRGTESGRIRLRVFQSPPIGVSHCNKLFKHDSSSTFFTFQSPPIGVSHCNALIGDARKGREDLSVPSHRG